MHNSRPIIGKIGSIYPGIHDKINPSRALSEEFVQLKETDKPIISIKFDGTCAIIIKFDESYLLCRRQDIKIDTPNYSLIKKLGHSYIIGSTPIFESEIKRGGKNGINVPIYFFNLDLEQMPIEEGIHVIGFTPLRHNYSDDKHACTAIIGTNHTPHFNVWTSTTLLNKSQIQVQQVHVAELMANKDILTVELMGPKISSRYGFKDNRHFIMPHGLFQLDQLISFEYDLIKELIESTNIEGLVLYFPTTNKLFKVNRGHLHSEDIWQKQIECGHEFVFDS